MNVEAPKALVLLGPTASGKSDLAMMLARGEYPCEIIIADSMQVYRGMDIGTAKPTLREQAEVTHHCLDLVDPGEDFSVEMYQKAVDVAFSDIKSRNPKAGVLIVGGTGLYVRAIVDNLQIPPRYPHIVEELDTEPDTPVLWERLNALDPKSAETMLPTNRRRILRALEVTLGSGRPFSSFGPGLRSYVDNEFLQVGIRLPREVLDRRIDARYEAQMQAGFLEEVMELSQKPLAKTARQALGYKELLAHLEEGLDLEEALFLARRRTKRFARRQERWFRRDPRIKWIDADDPQDALENLTKLYAEYFDVNLLDTKI